MKHISFLLSLLLCLPLSAQQTYRARVVDAETGKALPYVYIYMTILDDYNCSGMATDAQGYFECFTEPDSVLLFSCVGYEKLSLKAREIKDIVRLKPLTILMNELIVTPPSAQAILEKAASELEKDYEQHKRELSYYKSNITLIGEDSITLERRGVYFESECNLRFFFFESYVFTPTFMLTDYPGDAEMLFNYRAYLCELLSVGPYIKESKFWSSTITPLGNPNLYASSYVTLTRSDGQRIYKIDVSRLASNCSSSVQKRTAVLGTLYLDADTYLPLRFRGTVKNLTFRHLPTELDFQINYHHKNGFAEITQFYLSGKNKKHRFRFALEYVISVRNMKNNIYTMSYSGVVSPHVEKRESKSPSLEEFYKLSLASEDYKKHIKKSIVKEFLARQRRFVKQRDELWKDDAVHVDGRVSTKRIKKH